MIDIDAVRADTPASKAVIHLNNCGSSLPPQPVIDAALRYFEAEVSLGGYEAYAAMETELDAVYAATARYLGCDDSEVAYTAGAGDSWWRAFSAIPLAAGDRILTSHAEYQANAFAMLQAKERGISLEIVPNDERGLIDLESLANMLDSQVKVVTLTHIAMANGAVQPAAAVGALAKEAGAIYILDSCQAAGQMPLNVDALNCDFLAYTGRKFMRGLRGSGILYARSSVIEDLGPPPFVDGRSAEWTSAETIEYQPGARRFEYGEQNFIAKAALGAATDYALELGFDHIARRVAGLSNRLRTGLSTIAGVELLDLGLLKSGIVTFALEGRDCAAVVTSLAKEGINVGAPGARNSQWDIGHRGIDAVVRAGVHYFNTESEIDRTVEVVSTLA